MVLKGRGGRIARLIDKTIFPDKETYAPPKKAVEQVYTIPLIGGEQLTVRVQDYRGKTVDFAITQATPANRRWSNVARIDCCWGTVHHHLFDKFGNVLKDHDLICEIPVGPAGWDVVNEQYPKAYDRMHNEWEDNLRRWHGDRD